MRGQSVREAYTVARRWLAVSRNIGGAKRGRAWALLYDHRFSIAQRLLRVFFGIQRTASSSRLVDNRFAVCPGLPVVCLDRYFAIYLKQELRPGSGAGLAKTHAELSAKKQLSRGFEEMQDAAQVQLAQELAKTFVRRATWCFRSSYVTRT